jgi:hypothetical protein
MTHCRAADRPLEFAVQAKVGLVRQEFVMR